MKEKNIIDKIKESKKYIQGKIKSNPKIAIVCGSGLSNIKNMVNIETVIAYSKIPYFKQSTVEGHVGELVVGKINSEDVILLNGRLHYYEGYSMQEVSYPIRVMKSLGIEKVIITCAVGAINKKYDLGDIVVIKDHVNFMFDNPLIGKHYSEFLTRFPDMTNVYNKEIIKKISNFAKRNKIKIQQGIYLAVSGPAYETPAEICAYKKLGADVIGMSLVPESIVANQMNMEIVALTYVSNKASGLSKNNLTHKEVLKSGQKVVISLEKIIKKLVRIF